jgi:hypothetical protein
LLAVPTAVFNLSALRREEAEALIREKEGRLCVRYFQRADGTIMTRDCPEGRRQKLRKHVALALGLVFALVGGLLLWARSLSNPGEGRHTSGLREREPFRSIMEWLDPAPPTPRGPIIIGAVPPEDAKR